MYNRQPVPRSDQCLVSKSSLIVNKKSKNWAQISTDLFLHYFSIMPHLRKENYIIP